MRVAALLTVLFALCACGGRDVADDQTLHSDVVNGRSGAEVTFDATVLDNPVESGGHERFDVKAATGERLEVDHNTTLAPVVPVHAGDAVVIHGELYIDPGPRIGVHCTHATTSSGCPNPGWIMFGTTYYE
ncbi:MAG: DUF3465 domain-containing protein [Chloroflexi bacterium]|nr:MAG: DUF3465 domain-containing protein [Chloroflexota bacterium]